MRNTMLYTLYRTMVLKQQETLQNMPDYQWAMEEWKEKQNGNEVDLEDGVTLRERIWGELTFYVGLDAGLRLAQELEAMFQKEKP